MVWGDKIYDFVVTITPLDRTQPHPGYWPSAWPVECGGNRRQKAGIGGLDVRNGTASVVSSKNHLWNVMAIERERGQWFVGGTMAAFSGPPPHGWVQRIDPDTLEPLATSPELPCGEHVWCGAILAHANGSIHSVNGSYIHRLDPDDLSVLAERKLPADRAHNGMLALSDGTIVTKDLRLEGQGGTTITRLDPDSLELVGEPLVMPEGSMGRIAADHHVIEGEDTEHIYVPGIEHLFRLTLPNGDLVLDDWRAKYRNEHDQWGLAWDACLSEGSVWLMDCGDVESVRMIHNTLPNGRWDEPPGASISWRRPAPWTGAQRLLRVSIDDPTEVETIEPFGIPGGGIIAPPVHVPDQAMAIAWDSVNGGLAGVSTDGALDVAWHLDVRPSMQPVVFPDTGELVINDFTEAGSDDVIVVDIATGELIDRVATGSRIANGMFLSAGGDRDVWYCTTTVLARIRWR